MRFLRSVARIWTILLATLTLALALAVGVRFVAPLAPWLDRPSLLSSVPANGATEVVPRTAITLTFNQPMNRHSVERALQIAPPTGGTLTWRDGGRTLVFTPATTLIPDVTYSLRLNTQALGRWWQPLVDPLHIAFRTAQAPTVVAALPSAADVPTDASLALIFSQPMAPPDQLGQPLPLPQLSIDPPVSGVARWIDTSTLLLQPDAPLRPATSYQATLAASLTDLRGTELERPFTWTWQTRGPRLLARSPDDGERWVGPRQPLRLTLAPPLDLATLRNTLSITPTVAGDLQAATQPNGTQVVTFTPSLAWQPGRTYTVRLQAEASAPSNAAQATRALGSGLQVWRFTAQPEPTLVARFPGLGQLLTHNQAIRLIFSTPMDATTLRTGLTLDPPAGELQVSVSETEVRVQADLRPATVYTLTVAATVPDRNGVPLGNDYRLRVLTAAAEPRLVFPTINGQIVNLPVGQPATLSVERTNLSALDLALYRLDEATLLRTLSFGSDDWNDFRPERYNQPLVTQWRLSFTDPPDTVVRATLPITQENRPLDPGSYYLQVRSPEGPRSDLILLVSPVSLALKQSEGEALVWATDVISGTPLADLPLTLYRGEAVVARGRSDTNGVWRVSHQRRPGDTPYLVIAGVDAPAVVRSDWQLPTDLNSQATRDGPDTPLLLFTDRRSYVPGTTVQVSGLVRQAVPYGGLALPVLGSRLNLALQRADSSAVLASVGVALPASGVVSASLPLDATLLPGAYNLRATLGEAQVFVPIQIVAPNPLFVVSIGPSPAASQVALREQLTVWAKSAGVPVAGVPITWSAVAMPLAQPEREGFRFGDDEQAPNLPLTLEGQGVTDAQGRFELPLPDQTTLTQTLRYAISVRGDEPGGVSVTDSAVVDIAPLRPQLGIRLASQIVPTLERPSVEVLTLDRAGAPASGIIVNLEVYRRTWISGTGTNQAQPRDTQVLARRITTDAQGQARIDLVRLSPGEYRVVAKVGLMRSSSALWVTAPAFTGWRNDGERVRVVTDRDYYRAGDVAQLLVTMPYTEATALLTLEQSGVISAELRTLRASQPLTLTVTPAMAPNVYVGVLLIRPPGQAEPTPFQAGYVELSVRDSFAPLTTTITSDRAAYLPGETATLTITTRDAQGQGLAADLLFALHRATEPLPQLSDLTAVLNPARPAGFITAQSQAGRTPPVEGARNPARRNLPPDLLPTRFTAGWQTGPDGTLVVRVPLPLEPGEWQAMVFASRGADSFGQAQLTLNATPVLLLDPQAPPALYSGDRADVLLTVRNTTALTQELRAMLTARGAVVQSSPNLTQTLSPGAEYRFGWVLSAALADAARLDFRVETTSGAAITTYRDLPVVARDPWTLQSETLLVSGLLTHTITVTPAQGANLSLELAADLRTALAQSAKELAAQTDRRIDEEASLLYLSALLARNAPAAEARQWQAQARSTLDVLERAQASTGGWGWWPGDPFNPFVTGYVLEAQAVAREIFALDLPPNPRALGLLRRADRSGADPDLRAYIQYVLMRLGQGNVQSAEALLANDLQTEGLAYLALALPPDRADELVLRLLNLVRRVPAPAGNERRTYWDAGSGTQLARSSISTTALVVQVLQRQRPDSLLLGPARQTLAQSWQFGGWPSAFDMSRIAAAVLSEEADSQVLPASYRLFFNNQLIGQASSPFTSTQRIQVPGDQLQALNELRIEVNGLPGSSEQSAVLLAYRLTLPDAPNAARPKDVPYLAVYQEYLDPLSGALLDPATLRWGQLLRVRQTVVLARPRTLAELDLQLPAALALVEAVPSAPFSHIRQRNVGLAPVRLAFFAADLAPGVYTQTFLARVVASGTFVVPPPRIVAVFTPGDTVQGRVSEVRVTP